jgi:hypothetical protein
MPTRCAICATRHGNRRKSASDPGCTGLQIHGQLRQKPESSGERGGTVPIVGLSVPLT